MATTDLSTELSASRWARPIVALSAALAPTVIWSIAVQALDREVTVPESPGSAEFVDLELGPVLGASILAVVAGWLLLAVLEWRLPTRALAVWTVAALVVLVLSLPWNPDFTATERVVIATMHLALGAILILGMRATHPRDDAA